MSKCDHPLRGFAGSIGGEKYIIKVYEYFGVIAVFASSAFRLVYMSRLLCVLCGMGCHRKILW